MSIIITEQEHSLLDNWVDSINKGDLDKLCTLYSPKAVLIPSTTNIVKQSPNDIRDYFATALQKEKLTANLLSCNTLYENGHQIYRGNYAFTWYEEGRLRSVKAQYSFVIDNEKIIVHHSSLLTGI